MSPVNTIDEQANEEGFDFKKILFILVRQWQWFLLFAAIGFASAYLYTKVTKSLYTVSTLIMVPEKSTGVGLDMKSMFQGVVDQPQNNIFNQIEIIGSYTLINQTLINLNWRTNWYKKELFVWESIYKQEPYEVREAPNFVNLGGIPITITPTTENTYSLSCAGKAYINGAPTNIKFEGTGTYGQPFINPYFNFTLVKKPNVDKIPDGKYQFAFNDLNQTARSYQGKLKVSLKTKLSDIILCTITSSEPQKDVEFLNELLKVYIGNKMNLQNEGQKRTLDFVNNQLTGISDSMNSAGTRFTNFRAKNNIIDLDAEGTLVMNNLKEIETQKATNQMQLDYFHNILAYLNEPGNQKQLISPSVVGIEDPMLNSLVVKLGDLYNRRQIVSFSTKENNPAIALIDKEISQTRSQLTENLRNLINNATKAIGTLQDRQNNMSTQLNKLPEKEQQMIDIQRQFNVTNELYTFLLKKRAETNITLASSVPDVQIIDAARTDGAVIVGIPHNLIYLIGIILGLGLPLLLIILLKMFDSRIRTQEDIENNSRIPIIGNIMHDESGVTLIVNENPKSVMSEAFRTFRTNLQYMLAEGSGSIISIQSTHPGEGKTFVSVNLASILAMNDKKVIILGVDLRKPKLHHVFDVSNDKGLSTYLIGYNSLAESILPTKINNLFVLPAGPIPPNPAELIGKPEMKNLLDTLRKTYDYIILDNAPVSYVTDGIIAGQMSDLNVFILRYGISRKQQLEMINHYEEKKMVSHPAIVVNDIKLDSFGYSYSKYGRYESYYRYSYKKSYNYNYYASEEDGTKTRRRKKS